MDQQAHNLLIGGEDADVVATRETQVIRAPKQRESGTSSRYSAAGKDGQAIALQKLLNSYRAARRLD